MLTLLERIQSFLGLNFCYRIASWEGGGEGGREWDEDLSLLYSILMTREKDCIDVKKWTQIISANISET